MVEPLESSQNSPREEISLREEILREIFANILGLERVEPDGNFFDLGGSSLLALRLEQELLDRGIRIPALALVQTPTPAGLASRPDLLRKGDGRNIYPLRNRGDDFPFFFIHIAWGLCWSYLPVVEHIPDGHPLYGVQARREDDDPGFPGSIREMSADYIETIRTVQESGPYHIAGWSFGGLVAHEVGVQLQAAGEQVAELILFDAFPADPDRVADDARWPVKFREVPTLDEIIEDMYAESALIPVGLSRQEIMTLARIRQNNIKIGLAHRPSRFDGDLILIVAAESHPGKKTVIGPWQNYVTGTIHEAFVPCLHNDMFKPDMAGQTWAGVETLRGGVLASIWSENSIWCKIQPLPGRRQQPAAVCAVGCCRSGCSAGGAGDQLAGFGVGERGGLDGDFPAEAFQAADVAGGAAAGVLALLGVAGAEVAVLGCRVGQQRVGDAELGSVDARLVLPRPAH